MSNLLITAVISSLAGIILGGAAANLSLSRVRVDLGKLAERIAALEGICRTRVECPAYLKPREG